MCVCVKVNILGDLTTVNTLTPLTFTYVLNAGVRRESTLTVAFASAYWYELILKHL